MARFDTGGDIVTPEQAPPEPENDVYFVCNERGCSVYETAFDPNDTPPAPIAVLPAGTEIRVARTFGDAELRVMRPSELPLSIVRGSVGSVDDTPEMSPERNAYGQLFGPPGTYEDISNLTFHRVRLSGARLCNPQDVLALQGVGNGFSLDGRRRFKPHRPQAVFNVWVQFEVVKTNPLFCGFLAFVASVPLLR